MKYMTKEWYETSQKGDLHLLLKASKKAEVFSQEYYRELYKKEEAKWLKLQKEVANTDVNDFMPEEPESYGEHVDGSPLDPEEEEEAKAAYYAMREGMSEYQKNREPFDPEREKAVFKASHRYNIKHLNSALPDRILQKVADIRVLALNRAAANIKEEITQYCKANNKAVQKTQKAYWREYAKAFRNGEPTFAEQFNFHDCKVISCRQKGNDIIVELENSGGFTDIERIIFKNCTVVTKESSLHGAWWLYDEIYAFENGYEIHVLLQSPKGTLLYFTVVTGEVELQK